MFEEGKKLFLQFATVVGVWIIAHYAWAKYVKPYSGKFRNAKATGSSSAQFRYNQYQL